MKYLSVCSGIEAATVAWHPLGFEPVGFSEIEPFPSAVLAHHYPHVPNLGDMNDFDQWPDDLAPDLVVGGTPCQSFSVAGIRGGLGDARGQLALVFALLVRRYRPRWVLWENVPGVLSSNGGRDFGSIVGALAELGYGWAYRVLDAQYYGVPQQRRRVFLVGHSGADHRRAAQVLFERESMRGDPPPRRTSRQAGAYADGPGGRVAGRGVADVAPTLPSRNPAGGGMGTDFDLDGGLVSTRKWPPDVAATLGADFAQKWGLDDQHIRAGAPFFTMGFNGRMDPVNYGDMAGTLDRDGGTQCVASDSFVRRLTPTECERLQGFPDGYTNIPYRGKDDAPDTQRYKALGNSMAVPVMRWIGERMARIDAGKDLWR